MTTIKNQIKDATRIMNSYGKVINFYNKKYNYNIEEEGTEKEIKEYNSAINIWDQLKAKRDVLKSKV